MTPDSNARRIVVGYDGSPASRAALARAAERAGEDGRIYIVHAYSVPIDWHVMPSYATLLELEIERAQALVDRIDEESGADLHGVAYETEVVGDLPARAIARAAATHEADEIVVGTRGYGRARALLGSVAHELIHLADCPITVIPERVVDRHASREKTGAAA